MRSGDENHDGHDGHDEKRIYGLRNRSPLSPAAERAMTMVLDRAIAVHKALGPGFIESVYKKAMCIALQRAGLRFECEKPIDVYYEGIPISGQRVDLIVEGLVVVELKSVQRLDDVHYSQLVSYLRTMHLRAGLLMNFRVPLLHQGLKRIIV
jgi:GxxExxY protein